MATFISFLSAPFRWLGKSITFLRNLIFNLLFILLVLFIIGSLFIDKAPLIKTNSALVLSINGDVVEEKEELKPFEDILFDSLDIEDIPAEVLLQDILDVINSSSKDPRISCLVLKLKKMGNIGLDQLQVIGSTLEQFKQSGKKIIAIDDMYRQKNYYLASFADKIFLNPAGSVEITGFGLYRLYLRDAIEKLRVNFHVFRVGEYKSAVEVITRNSMSSIVRQQNRTWLTSLWNDYTDTITTQRSLAPRALDSYTNNFSTKLAVEDGDRAQLALKTGLVDEIKQRPEIRSYLATQSAPDKIYGFRQISFRNYLKTINRSYQSSDTAKDKVGIIIASGTILNGKQSAGRIGGDSLSEAIRKAKQDKSIKAVVLRVRSGGGSLFASEIIRQELLALKKSGKPLVISMGSIAASGGYFIAADGDEIWASPSTITGSIGIFAAIPTFENSLAKMGIASDGLGTTSIASARNLAKPLSPSIKEAIQLSVNHGYSRLLDTVSKGRNIDRDSLSQMAQGKLFTGKKALELGLVDKLGTLQDAIKSSAQRAGLTDYSAEYVSRAVSLAEKLVNHFSTSMAAIVKACSPLHPFLKEIMQLIQPLNKHIFFNDPHGIYAHCMIDEF